MAQEPDPLVTCLEAARDAVLAELRADTDCTGNTALVAELAARANAINQLLDEIR